MLNYLIFKKIKNFNKIKITFYWPFIRKNQKFLQLNSNYFINYFRFMNIKIN